MHKCEISRLSMLQGSAALAALAALGLPKEALNALASSAAAEDGEVVTPWLTLDPAAWRLDLRGLVRHPQSFTLAEMQRRPRRRLSYTLECAGNHGFPFFTGGIGTAVWGGTPLAPLLRAAGPLPAATEVIFWGADAGPGPVGDQIVVEQFARSMSLADALDENLLLCDEMNGVPLHPAHGAPVRLIAPAGTAWPTSSGWWASSCPTRATRGALWPASM